MFTGVIDKEGEETVRELGGEMVDSVYHCTHLVTDKVHVHVHLQCTCRSLLGNVGTLDSCLEPAPTCR